MTFMRFSLTLFTLACVPAFCQDVNTQQITITAPPANVVVALGGANECSIPLLNAMSPSRAVPMPNSVRGRNTPQQTAPATMQSLVDRMKFVAPAPACRSGFRLNDLPRLPAPATAPTPKAAP